MRDLPREKILSRGKSRNPSAEESSSADATAHGKPCLCYQARQNSTRTLSRPLARHVDFAAAQEKIANQRRNSHVDLSVHKSPRHSQYLPETVAPGRQPLAGLVRHRSARLDSTSRSAPPRDQFCAEHWMLSVAGFLLQYIYVGDRIVA